MFGFPPIGLQGGMIGGLPQDPNAIPPGQSGSTLQGPPAPIQPMTTNQGGMTPTPQSSGALPMKGPSMMPPGSPAPNAPAPMQLPTNDPVPPPNGQTPAKPTAPGMLQQAGADPDSWQAQGQPSLLKDAMKVMAMGSL